LRPELVNPFLLWPKNIRRRLRTAWLPGIKP
jgi:hypothetical protein